MKLEGELPPLIIFRFFLKKLCTGHNKNRENKIYKAYISWKIF
jgi:hypothetical protein